jgi:hypothetical protein
MDEENITSLINNYFPQVNQYDDISNTAPPAGLPKLKFDILPYMTLNVVKGIPVVNVAVPPTFP